MVTIPMKRKTDFSVRREKDDWYHQKKVKAKHFHENSIYKNLFM